VDFMDSVWMFWLGDCWLQVVDLMYFDLELYMMDFSVSVKKNFLKGFVNR
jgi:hypothetical protein